MQYYLTQGQNDKITWFIVVYTCIYIWYVYGGWYTCVVAIKNKSFFAGRKPLTHLHFVYLKKIIYKGTVQ